MGIGQAIRLLHRLLNRGDIGLYIVFSHGDLRLPRSYALNLRKTFPDATKNPPQ